MNNSKYRNYILDSYGAGIMILALFFFSSLVGLVVYFAFYYFHKDIRYNDAFIRIMKNTNDFEKVDKIFDENQYMYYAIVKQKEFIEMDAKRRTGNIVKYFDSKFHIFDNKPEYDYKPETNEMIFNFDSKVLFKRFFYGFNCL